MEVPDSVVKILKEFRDMMHAELPKELPPRQPIDHKIELLPGTKALIMEEKASWVGLAPMRA